MEAGYRPIRLAQTLAWAEPEPSFAWATTGTAAGDSLRSYRSPPALSDSSHISISKVASAKKRHLEQTNASVETNTASAGGQLTAMRLRRMTSLDFRQERQPRDSPSISTAHTHRFNRYRLGRLRGGPPVTRDFDRGPRSYSCSSNLKYSDRTDRLRPFIATWPSRLHFKLTQLGRLRLGSGIFGLSVPNAGIPDHLQQTGLLTKNAHLAPAFRRPGPFIKAENSGLP